VHLAQPKKELMTREQILALVAEKWRPSFIDFVQSGKLESDFAEYLNTDPNGQRALDEVFETEARSIPDLLRALDTSEPQVLSAESNVAAEGAAVAHVIDRVSVSSDQEQRHFMESLAKGLRRVDADQQSKVQQIVARMSHVVSSRSND
jgi:hypothetical protein